MWVQANLVYTEFQDYTMRPYLKTRKQKTKKTPKIPLIFFKIMCICLCLYMGVWIRVQLPEANNNPLELELRGLWADKDSLLQQQSALPDTPFSPAPLTLKPPPHCSTSLYSTGSKLLAMLPFLLPILPLSHDSRPSTFLSSFHPNDPRLMTYWPTFTFSSLVLLNSSTWAKWQAFLNGSQCFVPLIWLLPIQKSVLESEQLTTPCNAPYNTL